MNNSGAALCLQSQPHLGSRMHVSGCYTREAAVGRPICDLSRIIATRQLDAFTVPSSHYVTNNCIYVRFHLFDGTNSIAIDSMTMKDWLFSQHQPPAPRHQQSCHFFLLAVMVAVDCALTLAFHVVWKICRIKTSLQFISTFGHNITLSLEYLGSVAVFQ